MLANVKIFAAVVAGIAENTGFSFLGIFSALQVHQIGKLNHLFACKL